MRLHYCKVSTFYIYSVIADVRLLLWQRTFLMYIQSAARAYFACRSLAISYGMLYRSLKLVVR